jgi:hypothetical protein
MSELSTTGLPDTHIISCLPPADDTPDPTAAARPRPGRSGEARREVRWRCNLEVRCQSRPGDAADEWWPGQVQNLSAGGLLVVGPGPSRRGTLAVEFRSRVRGVLCLLLARVVHARPVEGGWAFGCELTTRLSERQLRALLL